MRAFVRLWADRLIYSLKHNLAWNFNADYQGGLCAIKNTLRQVRIGDRIHGKFIVNPIVRTFFHYEMGKCPKKS